MVSADRVALVSVHRQPGCMVWCISIAAFATLWLLCVLHCGGFPHTVLNIQSTITDFPHHY
jgi:hypothetical protein